MVEKYLMSKFTLVTCISYRTVGEALDLKLKAVVSVVEPMVNDVSVLFRGSA